MNLVECRCGQSFIATAGEKRCSGCEAAVPKGLCGWCDTEWDPETDAVAA